MNVVCPGCKILLENAEDLTDEEWRKWFELHLQCEERDV